MTNGKKPTTKLLIHATDEKGNDKGIIGAWRAFGPWVNPGKFSGLGTDLFDDEILVAQAREKYGLESTIEDWEDLGTVEAETESIRVMRLRTPVKRLQFIPGFGGGLLAEKPENLWEFVRKDMMSPGMEPLLYAFPDIFGAPPEDIPAPSYAFTLTKA
ncbi:MAG: hypothetical protein COY40_03250 [Alphaproteobacteria bacterium CG_4_10_14_0_8_um_filter_53_9]|nr:MAG: hypothetical protein COY40_03250 [Alphaproteobacteria bacterium CG_4_10_14_0_8_um_filter_53_9]